MRLVFGYSTENMHLYLPVKQCWAGSKHVDATKVKCGVLQPLKDEAMPFATLDFPYHSCVPSFFSSNPFIDRSTERHQVVAVFRYVAIPLAHRFAPSPN